jgi:hypothetical protein
MGAALADIVLDLGFRMLASEIFKLLEDDQVLRLVKLGDLDEHDVRGFVAAAPQGVRRFDVGVSRNGNEHREQSEVRPVSHESTSNGISDDQQPTSPVIMRIG